MRGRKRLHHEAFLEEERRAPDFVAVTRDDERLCAAFDLTKTRLASQAAQAATCQSSEGDSGGMQFSCEHPGQAMVIGNFCSLIISNQTERVFHSLQRSISRNNSSANCPKRNPSDRRLGTQQGG